MADEIISQLILDAQQVLGQFAKLVEGATKYTQSLEQNAAAAATFNAGQNQIQSGLTGVNQKLAEQRKLAAEVANQLRSSFQSGFANPTLAEIKKVNDAFLALEKTIVSTGASQSQINNVLKNLGNTGFTGADARIQSAIIAAQKAATGLGTSNAAGTFNINEAAVRANAKQVAQIQAQEQAIVAQQTATRFAANFRTGGADTAAIDRFQVAVQRFQTVAQNSKLSATQLSGVINNLGQVFTGAEGKVATAALQVQKLGQALQGVTTTSTGFGLNFQSIISRFTFLEALRGLSALQQAFTNAIPQSINFERQLAQVATISGDADSNINTLGVRVSLLADQFGKPAPEVAAGLYHALSNQVGDTAQTVQFLTEALKFSKAAVTDVSSSVDALSGIQNAYGQTSASASHNADVLFRTIDLGRVSAKELGDSFGRILPIASQLGVSLEEVSAAIATATVQGVKFQDAQTQTLNLLIAALKPTGDFKARMHELGIETTNAGIAADGFVGFFSKIGQNAKSSEELAKLFANIRGLRGEISLFADGGKKLADFLDQIEKSAGAAQKAFETIQFSNAEKVSNELARVQNQILQGFGRDAVAVLAGLNDAFGGVASKVVFLGEALATALGGAVVFTAANQGIQLLASLGGVFGVTATAATGFGLAVVAAAALATAAFKLLAPRDFATDFIEQTEKAKIAAAQFATDSANRLREQNREITKGLHEQLAEILQTEQQKQAIYNSATSAAIALEKANSENFLNQISRRERAFTNFINSVKQLQDGAAESAKRLTESQQERNLSFQQTRFSETLSAKTPDQQAIALNQQVNRLISASQAAFKSGSGDFARKAIADAQSLAFQFEKITGNRVLANKVNAADNALTNQELQKNQQQVSTAQQLEKSNTSIVEKAREQLTLAKDLDAQKQKALTASGGRENDQTRGLDTQIKTALKAADAFTSQLNVGLLKVGDKVFNGTAVQHAIDELRKAQQGINLEFSFQKGIDNFRAEVKKQFEANPIAIEAKLKFDPDHDPSIQQKIADLKKQIDRGLENETAVPGAVENFRVALDAVGAAFDSFKKQLDDAAAKSKLDVNPLSPGAADKLSAIDEQQKKNVEALDNTKAKINEVFTDPGSFNEFGKLTVDAFKKLEELLGPFKEIIKDATSPDASAFDRAFGDMAQKLIDSTKQAAILQETLQGLRNEVEAGVGAQGKLQLIDPRNVDAETQRIRDLEKELNDAVTVTESATNLISNSFSTPIVATVDLTNKLFTMGDQGIVSSENVAGGLSSIGITAEEQIPGVQALTAALFEMAAAEAAGGGGGGGGGGGTDFTGSGGSFASLGSLIQRFAFGGQARGTDTVPAMLTPGEIVMNPKASRNFFSTLMAMNAGAQPSFRSNGGQVGDSFGDINVNITANSGSDINARAIARGIQREVRKGNIRRT